MRGEERGAAAVAVRGEERDELGVGAAVLPKVGSSSTSRGGAVASAVATERRRCSPPESVNGFAAARWVRCSRSRRSIAIRRASGA